MQRHPSHLKAGLLAGALFGLAAGIFMSSKQGKKIVKELRVRTKDIQGRLEKELKKTKGVSQESYADAIDKVLAYYIKSKEIASAEVPELRTYLMARWKHVQKDLKSMKKK
jgi:gas vesicle protein